MLSISAQISIAGTHPWLVTPDQRRLAVAARRGWAVFVLLLDH
jgi:hypothetical protein